MLTSSLLCYPDREIFRLRDELATYEGPDVTFYDFLGVKPSASQDDISKAYRKKSRSLHPDKVKQQLTAERAKAKKNKKPGVTVAKAPTQAEVNAAIKAASDRQSRLSIVANILKGPGRARYDHFIANGFPVWKGTNYFYERYRPGLGTVMVGVFIALGGGAHYLALYMGWKRQREFVERYIKFARHAAWGDNLGIPAVDNIGAGAAAPPPPAPEEQQPERALPTNRKMRRMQEREAKREASQEGPSKRVSRKAAPRAAPASGAATPTPAAGGPQGAKKRVVAENGKVLIVDSLGDVYLEQEDEEGKVEAFLLDVSLQTPLTHCANHYANQKSKSPMRSTSPRSAIPPLRACPFGSTAAQSAASSLRTTATTTRRSRTRTRTRRKPRPAQTLRRSRPVGRTPHPARAGGAHPAPALPTTTSSSSTSRWRTSAAAAAAPRLRAASPRASRARVASARTRGSEEAKRSGILLAHGYRIVFPFSGRVWLAGW